MSHPGFDRGGVNFDEELSMEQIATELSDGVTMPMDSSDGCVQYKHTLIGKALTPSIPIRRVVSQQQRQQYLQHGLPKYSQSGYNPTIHSHTPHPSHISPHIPVTPLEPTHTQQYSFEQSLIANPSLFNPSQYDLRDSGGGSHVLVPTRATSLQRTGSMNHSINNGQYVGIGSHHHHHHHHHGGNNGNNNIPFAPPMFTKTPSISELRKSESFSTEPSQADSHRSIYAGNTSISIKSAKKKTLFTFENEKSLSGSETRVTTPTNYQHTLMKSAQQQKLQ
jgi:hypothetical protein